MTPQQSEASRIDISSEQEKHYRGVTLQSTGKYLAQIHDRKRTATLFLGTFNTDVEAAKLHGSRAVLNVPVHEAGKSISKGCELLKCSGKKRKIKEKGSPVERTISNAESMPRLHIPNTLSILSQKKPSTVKNVAIPPPAAMLNMTLRQSIANQTDSSREQEKNYRGVKQQPNGKYIAQIHDRKKGATIFLGTFNTDIEAAKAFDSAAIRLHGSTAVLNLPEHEACKSSSKGCDLLECSGKKRKIKEKGRPVESTISNAEPPSRLHIPNTLTPSSTLGSKKPSIVKNIAIPPPEAILNITVQQSANKAETSMKQEKQYRGVRLQSTGKYGAKIRDPKSKATIWLGTFNSDIEAAKAFDSAAVRLRGSRALLNFHEHEAGKSSSLKGCEILKSSHKKRKMEVKGSSMEKHYRGVTLQSSGKYGAKIRDPNSKAYIWLGTFNTNIEAAKAFDSAAVRLCGSRAVLNFPKDEPGKSSSEGSELLESSCKKRNMEEKETSEEKHYRGVYHRPSGRYRAEISNKQGRIGLGTFNKDVEVTKAYDSAAFRLHGIGTVLNFPLEGGKSSSKQSESSQSSCKERKIQEMMNSVDSTIDDVEEVEVESSCKGRKIETVEEVEMENSLRESGDESVMKHFMPPSWKGFCYSEVMGMFSALQMSPLHPHFFPWLQEGEQNPQEQEETWNLVDEASKVGQLPTRQALDLYLQVLRWDIQDSWLCGGEM